MAALGFLAVRLVLAVVLFAHGAHTLFGAFAGPGIGPGGVDAATAHFATLGLQPAFPIAVAVGLAQFLGSLLIVIGWHARWAAGANAVVVLLTAWREQAPWGLFLNWTRAADRGQGIEYSLVLGVVLVLIVLAGPGELSIDARRQRYVAARAAGRARLRWT